MSLKTTENDEIPTSLNRSHIKLSRGEPRDIIPFRL